MGDFRVDELGLERNFPPELKDMNEEKSVQFWY